MELSTRRWYVTWFFLSLAILDRFQNRKKMGKSSKELYMERGTNLCSFVRTSFVWAPLVIILHVITYSAAIAAVSIVPVSLLGWKGYLSLAGTGASIVAFIVFVILGIILFDKFKDFIDNKMTDARHRRKINPVPKSEESTSRKEKAGPTFWSVIGTYVSATKQKICPLINFKT